MRANHDGLLARIGGQRPDWTALAKIFEQAGLTDRSGKPASPGTARVAWARVRESVARGRASRPPPEPGPAWPPGALPPPRATATHGPAAGPAAGPLPEPAPARAGPPAKLVLAPARVPQPGEPWKDDGSTLPKPMLRRD